MLSATDFVLKRFLKFVLKRKLGKYLHELDLAALDMDIGTSGVAVDVRNILLKCDQITADLALDGWEVRACYLGHVKAQLPFSALGMLGGNCCVQCDELLLTIAANPNTCSSAQRTLHKAASDPSALSNAAGRQQDGLLEGVPSAEELGLVGPTSSSMDDIIQRIAGGLHAMLHKLSVSVTNVLVRIEIPLDALQPVRTDQQGPAPSSGTVAIVSINLDSIQLTDQSQQPGAGAPVQAKQPGNNGYWSGSAAKAATGPVPGGSKQVHKQVEVKGLSIQMHVGPPVHASADAMEQAAAATGHTDSHRHGTSVQATSSVPAAGAGSATASIPLLADPSGGGIALTVGVCVTSSNNSAAAMISNGQLPDASMGLLHPAATSIGVHLQLGPSLLRVLPQHHACLSAVNSLLHHMQQQHHSAPAAAAAARHGPLSRMTTVHSDTVLQPNLVEDVLSTPNRQWAAQQQNGTWQGAGEVMAGNGNAGNGGVWGTSSLLSSFLLDDYHDLVATSLQPIVAQSLSLADSRMADGDSWATGPLSYSALYPVEEHTDRAPPRHAYSFSDRDAGHAGHNRAPARAHESMFSETASDMFQDANSVFSSYPNSAANSIHSATVAAQGPHPMYAQRPAWHDSSQAGYGQPPWQPPTPQPPPPTPPPPPEYHLTAHCNELQLFVGFGQGAPDVAGPAGLLVTTSEVAASCHVVASNTSGCLEVQQLHVMELAPATMPSSNHHAAASRASEGAGQQAWEFAAMPSKLHKSLNCFRPDPSWLVAPAWALTEPAATAPVGVKQFMNNPGCHLPGRATKPAPCVTWPLLYCGGGLRSTGVRPSVCIRILKPTVSADGHVGSYNTAHGVVAGNGMSAGMVPAPSWGNPVSFSAAHTEPLVRSRSSMSEASTQFGIRQPASGALQVQVELLPITLWACPAGIDRIQHGCQPLIDALSHTSSKAVHTGTHLHSNGNHSLPGPAVSPFAGSSRDAQPLYKQHSSVGATIAKAAAPPASLPELELSVSIPHICVIARFPLQAVQGSEPGSPRSHTVNGGQHHGAGPKPGTGPGSQVPQSLYMLLDVLCPSHQDHVSHQRMLPHQGPPFIRLVCGRQQGELLVRTSASCDVAAARLRLHVIHAAAPDTPTTPHPTPHTLSPHIPHHRHHKPTSLHHSQHHTTTSSSAKQHTASALGLQAASAPTRWVVLSLLEVLPRDASLPTASSGHQPAAGLGVHAGSQDLPPGCGLFASIQWDPQGPSNATRRNSLTGANTDQLVQASVQHYVDAHASSRWSDEGEEGEGEGEGPGWGGRASPGPGSIRAIQLAENCRESAHVFVHMRLSSAHIQLSDTDLATLTTLQLAAAPSSPTGLNASKPPTAVQTPAGARRQPLQVTAIIQASVLVTLKDSQHGAGIQQGSPDSTTPASFHLRLGEVSVLHVTNVAGVAGAMLLSVSAQDVQLMRQGRTQDVAPNSNGSTGHSRAHGMGTSTQVHGSSRTRQSQAGGVGNSTASDRTSWWSAPSDEDTCVLYCPVRPNSSSPQPCIDVLFYKPAQGSCEPALARTKSGASRKSAAPGIGTDGPSAPLLSVLVRGITISTDHGSLNLSWAQELAQMLTPPSTSQPPCARAPATATEPSKPAKSGQSREADPTQSEPPPPPLQLVVTLQDIALRHEPLAYPSQQVTADYIRQRCPEQAASLARAQSDGDVHTSHRAGSPGSPTAGKSSTGTRKQIPKAAQSGPTVSPVAMVLLAEHVRYELGAGSTASTGSTIKDSAHSSKSSSKPSSCSHQQHLVVINSVGLHLALAEHRGPGWGPGDSVDVAGCKLQTSGYHCVLSETALRVNIRVPKTPAAASFDPPSAANTVNTPCKDAGGTAGAADRGALVDVEIHNQQILGVLTQDSAALLLQLSAQLGTYIAAASAIPLTNPASGAPSRSNGSYPASQSTTSTPQASVSLSSSQLHAAGAQHASQGAGYESVRARTEQIMKELLAQEHYFKTDAGRMNGAGALPTAASTSGWYDHTSGSSNGGATSPTRLQPAQRPTTSGPHVIDDFFHVAKKRSSDELSTDLSTDWEHMPNSHSVVPVHHPTRRLHNSPPEAGGMWYAAQHAVGSHDQSSPNRMPNANASMGALSNSPPTGIAPATRAWGSLGGASSCSSYTSAVCGSPSASAATVSSLDRLSDITLSGYVPSTLPAVSHVQSSTQPPTQSATQPPIVQAAIIQSPSMSAAKQQVSPDKPTVMLPGLNLCEDYIPLGSPTSLLTAGSMQLGGSATQRPLPTVRITFRNFAGLSVLHTTRGSGGVQAGRVEAEVEGATLVVEMYPQGVHEAKLIHLSVQELEIRDCRAIQHMQPLHSSSAAGHDLSQAALWGVPHSQHSSGSSGGSSAGSSRSSRRYAAAARVGSGLANGVGVAAQLTLGKAAKLAVPGRGDPKKWVKILSYRQRADQPRDSRAAQLEVLLESVRPDPLHQPALEELRMKVRLLPVRLRLDQDVLQYLIAFGTAVFNPHTAAALELLGQLQLAAQSGGEAPALPFFQHVHLAPCAFTIDYRPRRIDVAALKAGSLVELLAMVPIGGLELDTTQVLLSGVAGWDQLGSAVAKEWITHIAQTQAHKFLLGLAPVHAVARVAGAVSSILGAPPLARNVSRGMARAATAATDTLVGLRRLQDGRMATQVREGVVTLARLLVAEALAARAHLSAAGGSATGPERVLTMQPLPMPASNAPAAPPTASWHNQPASQPSHSCQQIAEEEHLILELEGHERLWSEADVMEAEEEEQEGVVQSAAAGVNSTAAQVPHHPHSNQNGGSASRKDGSSAEEDGLEVPMEVGQWVSSSTPGHSGHAVSGVMQPADSSQSVQEAADLAVASEEHTLASMTAADGHAIAGASAGNSEGNAAVPQAVDVSSIASSSSGKDGLQSDGKQASEIAAVSKQQEVRPCQQPAVLLLPPLDTHRAVQPPVEHPIHVAQSPSCASTGPSSGAIENSTHAAVSNSSLYVDVGNLSQHVDVGNSSLYVDVGCQHGGLGLPTSSMPVPIAARTTPDVRIDAEQGLGSAQGPVHGPGAAPTTQHCELMTLATLHMSDDAGSATSMGGDVTVERVSLGLHHRSVPGHSSSGRLLGASSLTSPMCDNDIVVVSPVVAMRPQPSIDWAEYESVKVPHGVLDDQLKTKLD